MVVERRVRSRVPLWQAWVAVGVAFVSAALVGNMAGAIVRLSLRGSAASHSSLVVVLPAALGSGIALLCVAAAVPLIARVPQRVALGLGPAPLAAYAAAAFGTVMLGPLADTCMTAMEEWFPEATRGAVPMLHAVVSGASPILVWPVFALLPGLAEELLFRGVLQRAIAHRVAAVLVSGICFAAFHVDLHHVAGVLPLGIFLAWVAQRTSTNVTIIAHVTNNTFAIAAIHSDTFDVGYGTEHPMPSYWLPLSLIAVAASIVVVARATATRSVG